MSTRPATTVVSTTAPEAEYTRLSIRWPGSSSGASARTRRKSAAAPGSSAPGPPSAGAHDPVAIAHASTAGQAAGSPSACFWTRARNLTSCSRSRPLLDDGAVGAEADRDPRVRAAASREHAADGELQVRDRVRHDGCAALGDEVEVRRRRASTPCASTTVGESSPIRSRYAAGCSPVRSTQPRHLVRRLEEVDVHRRARAPRPPAPPTAATPRSPCRCRAGSGSA